MECSLPGCNGIDRLETLIGCNGLGHLEILPLCRAKYDFSWVKGTTGLGGMGNEDGYGCVVYGRIS